MAIKKLRNNPDVVIRQADKGGATTILNTTDYIFEAEKQLSNSDFYKILPEDPSRLFQPKIDELCQWYHNVATKIAELTPKDPSLGTFYTLPKVHKLPKLITEAQQALPGVTPSDPENIRRSDICKLARKLKLFPPCRPIISGIGTLTEHLSGYMDSVLNPLLTHIPSYIQDTTHFLRILNTIQALPINSLLVTMDVSSLYTNIPHDEGIIACQNFLREHATNPTLGDDLGPILRFILSNIISLLTGNIIYKSMVPLWALRWHLVTPTIYARIRTGNAIHFSS
ncbi:hypothetical protein BSL78_03210 [Apostichopus japonicus]|uniref:Reverse transcriptase domain-containing protein n=1 Tax=Stichopus japonicus TaxID=307972 RepID=A0A2G8LI35_STIJA|nr:hypothetical protein BSL78_03210 [Apostichopus japonicus]